MTTNIDAADIVVRKLNSGALKNAITGRIGKDRPLNSTKEDVVVKVIAITNDILQRGVVNVNLYVPNLKLSFAGQPDNTQPNYPRLNELTKFVTDEMDDFYSYDNCKWYGFTVQQPAGPYDADNSQSYQNVRINFRIEND